MATELLNTDHAAVVLDVKPATLIAWRHRRTGPPFVSVGRLVRYRQIDLNAWLAKQVVTPAC